MPAVTTQKAKYWILTIPQHCFLPYLPEGVCYIGGQLEEGQENGYKHWQIICVFTQQVRLSRVKTIFGDQCHAEASRSEAARDYCLKEDTRIDGTQFELGKYPFRRNKSIDWEAVKQKAKEGLIDDPAIPAQVYCTSYGSLKQIAKDHLKPTANERQIYVFVGETGKGKSRKAWFEAGLDAFPKDPRSKYWDGYQGQDHVVIEEFRGGIDISHVLRWFDRYPVIIENKFGATTFKARKLWITSNVHPRDWYPDLDASTKNALLRRLQITEFAFEWIPPTIE